MDSDAGVMKWKLFTQSSGRDKSTDFINKVLGKFVNESRVLISQTGTESPPQLSHTFLPHMGKWQDCCTEERNR